MIELPQNISAAPTLAEAAERLGELLGLDRPAPLSATQRALNDKRFAAAIITCRKMPAVRDRLLATGIRRDAPPQPSAARLATKAAGAVLKWGMNGLEHAKPWIIARRLAACNTCEFQAEAPDTLVYRAAKVVAGKGAKICTACDCLTNTKTALATERCPERDPDNPSHSRWGEPYVPVERHDKGPW